MAQTSGVPLLDLKAQYQPLREEILATLERVADSQYFIMGPEVEGLETEVAAYCRSKYALGVSSGTDALLLALMALDVGNGDEVITTPYSFFATAGSIARLGAKPVFVDIEPRTFNLDPTLIEKKITSRTKAIMPVHLFGQCAEMKPLVELSKSTGIPLVEDAAQAIGSEYYGERAGNFGAAGCFSFFPSKNLGAFGDAGLVTTNNDELYERMKSLRLHGSSVKYYHDFVGANFRIDAIQAAVLRIKLRHLDSWTSARQRNAARYQELFTSAGLAAPRDGQPTEKQLVLPYEAPNRRHIYNQYVVRSAARDQILAHLKKSQIGCEVYYPLSLHQQRCFKSLGYNDGDFPQSERAAAETFAIPIYGELSFEQQQEVVHRIGEALGV